MAIGGAITGSTDGGVLFVGAGGILAQDAVLTWDDVDNQLLVGAGAVGKPSLTFSDDTTGLYRPALDQVGVAVGGVLAMALGVAPTAADADMKFSVGRILIDSRVTDRMHISHRDMATSTQFAMNQTPTGGTTVSSTAADLVLAIGSTARWRINQTTFEFYPANDNTTDIGAIATRVRRAYVAEYWEGSEIADPAAPGADKGRLYFKDNGSAKTQLVVRFPTGAIQVIATEP